MKTLIFSFVLTLAFAAAGFGQKCTEFAVPGSPFAFCPPDGWTKKAEPGAKNVTFDRPAEAKKIGGGITVDHDVIEVPRETLAYQLIEAELKAEGYSNTRLVMAREFETTSGVKGTQLVFMLDMSNVPFVQVFFIFDGPKNSKLTVTATAGQDTPDVGRVVEAAMKTVRIKP